MNQWMIIDMVVKNECVNKSSAESQKGINAVQQCSIENQNGDITIDFVQQSCPSSSQ